MIKNFIKYIKTGTTRQERMDANMKVYEDRLRYLYMKAPFEGMSAEEIKMKIASAQALFIARGE